MKLTTMYNFVHADPLKLERPRLLKKSGGVRVSKKKKENHWASNKTFQEDSLVELWNRVSKRFALLPTQLADLCAGMSVEAFLFVFS